MRIIFQYLSYLVKAKHRKGHGIHSPFVFDFVSNVLSGRDMHDYSAIHERRLDLLRDRSRIVVEDHGAGSKAGVGMVKAIRHITKTSAIRPKYGRLLSRVVSWYRPGSIIELGTGPGISTSYLASGHTDGMLYSIEGSVNIHEIARETIKAAGLNNVDLIHGLFADRFPLLLDRVDRMKKLIVFIDGEHKGESLMAYCDMLLKGSFGDLLIILDDIYWSPSMTDAWRSLTGRPEIAVSIDLFQFGILFVKNGIPKQHYMIRF